MSRISAGRRVALPPGYPPIIRSVITHDEWRHRRIPGREKRFRITISLNRRGNGGQGCALRLRASVLYPLGFGLMLSGVRAERSYTHRIPTVSAFPNVHRPARSKHRVFPLRDAREDGRTWEGGSIVSHACSLEGANTPPPEIM